MPSISLQAAISLTQWSERTLRRRLADGRLMYASSPDAYKTRITLESVKPYSCIPLDTETIALIKRADAGDAVAQTELALLFLARDKPHSAVYWLELAIKQNFADAMQVLGDCYLSGRGVLKDDNLALMWIAKAASLGHPIALAQMKSIRLLNDDEIENRVD